MVNFNFQVEETGNYNISIDKIEEPQNPVLPTVNISSSLQQVNEGEKVVYMFTRSIPIGELIVDFMTDGAATCSVDYVVNGALSFSGRVGTVIFNDGIDTATIDIDTIADDIIESDEDIVINIIANNNYIIGTGTASSVIKDSVIIPPDPPIPSDPSEIFNHGVLPTDGYKATEYRASIVLVPAMSHETRVIAALHNPDGHRISGTMTIKPLSQKTSNIPDIPWRLLIDGVPQASPTVDTTQFEDGTYVFAIQIMDTQGLSIRSGSRIFVINNSGIPFTNLSNQAVINRTINNYKPTLAWGRVNVQPQKTYPLNPQLDKHPVATTNTDRERLVNEKLWWVEGLNNIGTPLWRCVPWVMKNKDGDCFIKQFNPEGGGSGAAAINALPYVECGPAYDGERGVGYLSPYTVLCADRHAVLNSGQTGWIGVDKSGRVTRIDITGEITTIFGPRSVEGVIGTDSGEHSVNLDARLANGEKEFVGDDGGQRLHMPQDIWVCDSFPFEGVIADTLNNRVVALHFDKQKLKRQWTIPEVSSVWGSYRAQQELRIAWFAVNPEGLWKNVVEVDGDNKPINHFVVEKAADIPDAFWVRVCGLRVFVMTLDLGLYEYNPITSEVTELLPRNTTKTSFCFMNFDEFGTIGPKERLYWSHAHAKTAVYWYDINTGETGYINKGKLINRVIYGSFIARNDQLGHYMWGFAPHSTLPKFIANGICSTSWLLWSACLGEVPVPDPRIAFDGEIDWKLGVIDEYTPPSAVFGHHGHGMIGYSADDFRDYKTWDEAKLPILEALEPFFWPELSQTEKENIGKQFFAQRTRLRF